MTTPAYLLIPDSLNRPVRSRKAEQVIDHDSGITLCSTEISAGTYIHKDYDDKDIDGNPKEFSGIFIRFLDKKESDFTKKVVEDQRKQKRNKLNEVI